jgi:hypothetical protein
MKLQKQLKIRIWVRVGESESKALGSRTNTMKIIGLLIYQVCAIMCNKISQCEKQRDRYFVDEVETQLRKKPFRGSQTQDIHYSEDKASYKAVALTYS